MSNDPLFYLFQGSNYYPGGGVHDLEGAYQDVTSARKSALANGCDWWHITDEKLNIVIRGRAENNEGW